MVNHFIRQEKAPESSFHHETMLKNVMGMLPRIGVSLLMDQNVAVFIKNPAFPSIVLLSKRCFRPLLLYSTKLKKNFHMPSRRSNRSSNFVETATFFTHAKNHLRIAIACRRWITPRLCPWGRDPKTIQDLTDFFHRDSSRFRNKNGASKFLKKRRKLLIQMLVFALSHVI